MPYLFASLKVAITLAFIGSVISETVGGNRGIGFLMLSAGARNDAPTTFAGLFAIAIMGVADVRRLRPGRAAHDALGVPRRDRELAVEPQQVVLGQAESG